MKREVEERMKLEIVWKVEVEKLKSDNIKLK